MIYKSLQRKLKIEPHRSNKQQGMNSRQLPTYMLRPQSLNSYGDPFVTSTRTTTNKVQGPKTNQILHINIEWKKCRSETMVINGVAWHQMKWMLRDKQFCRGSVVAKSPQQVKDGTLIGGPGCEAKEFRKLYGMTGVWQIPEYYLPCRQRK